ncbi:50S ribosomal protein L18 [candidate division KSB1 bacterium]|nr:50S ribosomal protein L18 [candidate division KSB1 bacterium]
MKNKKLYKTKKNRIKRKLRIRSTVSGTAERPRLTIYRSQRHIYAQLVDDLAGKTITGISTLSPQLKSAVEKAKEKGKIELGFLIGNEIAKKAKDLKIESVVYDRNGFIYHGRVKAVAEGARKGGLKF